MQVIVQGQQLDVGEALRFHVQEKLTDTCTKFFNHSIQGNVHFAREKAGYFRTDITLSVGNGIVLKSTAEAGDPYPAFDQANSRLVKQLKKYKERLKDHHAELGKQAKSQGAPANEYTFQQNDAIEHGEGGEAPVTLAELPTHVPVLTVADAVMRMDLADLNALLFHHAGHGRLNMVYRRKDGNIGWVDPQEEQAKSTAKTTAKTVTPLKTVAKKPAPKKPVAKKKPTKKAAKKPVKKAKKAAPKKGKKRK